MQNLSPSYGPERGWKRGTTSYPQHWIGEGSWMSNDPPWRKRVGCGPGEPARRGGEKSTASLQHQEAVWKPSQCSWNPMTWAPVSSQQRSHTTVPSPPSGEALSLAVAAGRPWWSRKWTFFWTPKSCWVSLKLPLGQQPQTLVNSQTQGGAPDSRGRYRRQRPQLQGDRTGERCAPLRNRKVDCVAGV